MQSTAGYILAGKRQLKAPDPLYLSNEDNYTTRGEN